LTAKLKGGEAKGNKTKKKTKKKNKKRKLIMTAKCVHSRAWHHTRDAALASGEPDVDIL